MEVIGAVAAAASLTKIVASVILKFGTRQNAPREVKRLEGILEDLNDKHLIESASEREKERLEDLISVAKATLNKHLKKPNPILQFFWPEDAEEQLRKLNDGLHNELVAIGLKVDRRYRFSVVSPITPTLAIPTPSSITNTSPAHPVTQTRKPSSPTHTRRATFDLTASAPTSDRKRGHELRATLYLQYLDGQNAIGPLEVKYLRILERDESTRLIHYERKTPKHNLEVTHRIPRSCLRFEDHSLNDETVSFLDAHPITVVRTGKGHEVFFLRAKYEFNSVDDREDFIARMLERELLDRFYAEEILYRRVLYAQGTVVRLWRKREDAGPSSPGPDNKKKDMVAKLTYLAREERQWEWDLKSFERRAEIDEGTGRVTLVEVDQGTELVIKLKPPPRTRKQSTPVTATVGTGTPKKRERTPSGQTTILPGPEDKDGLSPTATTQQPERKKSNWSLKRFSRTSISSIGKETLSADVGMRSPDSTSPSPAGSSPAMSHVSNMAEDDKTNNSSSAMTSSSGGNTNTTVPPGESPKSDAEKFWEIWKTHHPRSVPQLESLPPIVMTAPIGLGGWEGLGVGTADGSGYTLATGSSRSAARSPSTSPRASPLPASLGGGASSGGGLQQDDGTAKETGMAIQPRLEGLYPP